MFELNVVPFRIAIISDLGAPSRQQSRSWQEVQISFLQGMPPQLILVGRHELKRMNNDMLSQKFETIFREGEEIVMFSVDYPILVQILRQFLHTGLFRAHVMKSRVWSKEGYLEMHVKEGAVIACRFVSQQGEVSVWDRWDAQLTAMGVLN